MTPETMAYAPINTPGEVYALAYFISMLIACRLIGKNKVKWYARVPMNLGFFAALVWFMHETNGVYGLYFVLDMLVIIGMLFLMVVFNTEGQDIKRILYIFPISFMMAEFISSLTWQLYFFFIRDGFFTPTPVRTALFALGVDVIFFGLVLAFGRRIMAGVDQMEIHGHDVAGMFAIAFIAYIFSNFSYMVKDTPFSTTYSMEIFIIRTVTDLGGVVLLIANHHMLWSYRVRQENDRLRQTMHLQYDTYRLNEETVALVNQKYHDLKHQIHVLKRMNPDDEQRISYLDEIEESVKKYEAENKTGNHVLDTILTTKSLLCQSKNIELKIVADGDALSFMTDMDIAALFGNILDNAIEGTEKVQAAEERLINLSVSREKNFLRVREQNRYEGDLKYKNGMLLTTKEDDRLHGYGVKSIRQTAEKYGGTMKLDAKEGWFTVNILIPMPAQTEQGTASA